ncbi:hypothetical protein RYX36_003998, partial [Vicia faba]
MASEKNKVKRKGNDENDDDRIKKKNKSTESNEEPRRFFQQQQTQHQHQHQDLKSITGFQAFSNNSGSEVDDSGSIGKSQAACNEFGTHCVESGNEFVYSTAAATASGALSLGVAQSSEETAIVVADSDSSKKIVDTFGQRTSIYRGVTRHRWTVLMRMEELAYASKGRRKMASEKNKQQQQTQHQHQHQDLKSITGFQAFSNNSGSEVDDSGSIGKSQAACNEFGTHCVESVVVVLCRSELLRVPRKLLSSLLIQIARRKSLILLVSEPRFTVVSLGIDGQ